MRADEAPVEGQRYRITEGNGEGSEGTCVLVKHSTFGQYWAHIEDPNGNVYAKRASDIEPLGGD